MTLQTDERPDWMFYAKKYAVNQWQQAAQKAAREERFWPALFNWSMWKAAELGPNSKDELYSRLADVAFTFLPPLSLTQKGISCLSRIRLLQESKHISSLLNESDHVLNVVKGIKVLKKYKNIEEINQFLKFLETNIEGKKKYEKMLENGSLDLGHSRQSDTTSHIQNSSSDMDHFQPKSSTILTETVRRMKPYSWKIVQPPGIEFYTVKKGDNLTKIASRSGLTMQDWVDANPELLDRHGRIKSGIDYLAIDDQLRIPYSAKKTNKLVSLGLSGMYSTVNLNRSRTPNYSSSSEMINRICSQNRINQTKPKIDLNAIVNRTILSNALSGSSQIRPSGMYSTVNLDRSRTPNYSSSNEMSNRIFSQNRFNPTKPKIDLNAIVNQTILSSILSGSSHIEPSGMYSKVDLNRSRPFTKQSDYLADPVTQLMGELKRMPYRKTTAEEDFHNILQTNQWIAWVKKSYGEP